MELGGNAPFIVFDSTDVDKAIQEVMLRLRAWSTAQSVKVQRLLS